MTSGGLLGGPYRISDSVHRFAKHRVDIAFPGAMKSSSLCSAGAARGQGHPGGDRSAKGGLKVAAWGWEPYSEQVRKRENGDHFRAMILSCGNADDLAKMYKDCRGKDPASSRG